MGCTVCGEAGAGPVTVEYIDESTEQVSLCPACQREFEHGDLVTAVTPSDCRSV